MGCSAKYNIDPDEGAWVVQKQTYLRVCSEEDCATNSCDSSEYGSLVINTEDWVEWYAEWAEQYTESMCQNENYQYEVKYAAGEDVSAFEWSAECQEEVRLDEERSDDLTTFESGIRITHARTSVQDAPPFQPPQ